MTKEDKKLQQQYFAEARGWETDRVLELEKSRRTAWRVAAGSGVIALVSVFAVASLTPLKTVEPFVIRVDNATGIVDVVSTLKESKKSYGEAVDKFFVQWYVKYREGYSKELAEEYYSNVGIMSAGPEQLRYFDYFNPKNPLSPLNVYGQYAKVRIGIKSVSFIRKDIALVRYTKSIERGSDKALVTHWAATVSFKYSESPMNESDRAINPLGFQVVEYRNDPDTIADPSPVSQAVPADAPAVASSLAVFPTVGTPAAVVTPSAVVAAPGAVIAPAAVVAPTVPAIQR